MGYYTDFQVSVTGKDIPPDLDVALEEYSGYKFYDGAAYDVKWYNRNENMLKLSSQYPEAVFIVEGDGEEQGDQWIAYFKNGKTQYSKAQITFEPFDEAKLK